MNNNMLTSSQAVKLAQTMIAKGDSFECSLGVCMLEGNYKQRCKIMAAFPRKVEKYKPYFIYSRNEHRQN